MRWRVQGAGGQDDFDIDTVELNPAILAALAIILRVDTAIDPMRVRSFSCLQLLIRIRIRCWVMSDEWLNVW